jgi:hypothetical protein
MVLAGAGQAQPRLVHHRRGLKRLAQSGLRFYFHRNGFSGFGLPKRDTALAFTADAIEPWECLAE